MLGCFLLSRDQFQNLSIFFKRSKRNTRTKNIISNKKLETWNDRVGRTENSIRITAQGCNIGHSTRPQPSSSPFFIRVLFLLRSFISSSFPSYIKETNSRNDVWGTLAWAYLKIRGGSDRFNRCVSSSFEANDQECLSRCTHR